jgi:hypothetical protein
MQHMHEEFKEQMQHRHEESQEWVTGNLKQWSE